MNVPSVVLLILVALWGLWAVRYLLCHGACGCGGKQDCSGCCRNRHKCK